LERDLDLVADLRGLRPRDVPLAFGFALLFITQTTNNFGHQRFSCGG
jgi:hypothetical protein